MVHPLVVDTDGTFYLSKMGNRVLSKDSKTVAVDQIRDSMMDLRVNVVRASGKDNTSSSGFFKISKSFFSLCLNILSYCGKLFPCSVNRILDFLGGKLLKYLYKTVCKNCL